MNSGKPLRTPCPNCFECSFKNEESASKAYWLLYFLWQSKSFHPHLKGSVIPFIRIADVSLLLKSSMRNQEGKQVKLKESLQLLDHIENQHLHHLQILQSLQELKMAVLQKQLT